jgi:predicted transcriptional regulator
MLDLTPVGFTPTESNAYHALLELGPSSGYAVARALSIARANAYQALDGLVAKGAAAIAAERGPRRYRAVQPQTVFARIVDLETRKLDALERQLREEPREGAERAARVRGDRALNDLVVRAMIRADGPVRCLAPADRLVAWAPAIRARAAAGKPLALWSADGTEPDVAVPVAPAVADRVREALGDRPVVMVADGVLIGSLGPEGEGLWSGSPFMVGLVDAALRELTREPGNQPTG